MDDGELAVNSRGGGRPTELSDTTQALDRLLLEVEELRASRKRLVVDDDAARRALERALHDGAQQRLIALAVNLQLVRDQLDDDPVAAQQRLDEMGRDIQSALEETAKLAQRIYPPLLEVGGLATALRAAALAIGVKARIEVTATRVPPEVAGAVYHCCLEALELAAHGGSATIVVQAEDDVLSLEAFAATTDSEAVVGTARDRLEALGGALTVEPASHGVRMSGFLPLER